MRATWSCWFAVLLACVGWAQEKAAQGGASSALAERPAPVVKSTVTKGKTATAKKQLTPEERTGLNLLEDSLAESRKLDAVSQGEVAWSGARIYLRHSGDKAKAVSLLEEGFFSVLSAREEPEKLVAMVRTTMEARLLKALVPLDAARTEELLPQAEDKARKQVQGALVAYYLGHGNDARALELVRQVAVEQEMNYGDAITLMSHLQAGQESLRREIFTEALASYISHVHDDGVSPGGKDFPAMVLQFSSQMPARLVSQAIVEVLDQAKKADDKMAENNGYLQAHMATAKGEATWTKRYDYQLFALLPALRAVDPVEADARIKDSASARELLGKYENGLDDLAPSLRDPAKKREESTMSMSISTGERGGQAPDVPSPDARFQMQIDQEMVEHPENAMAKVPQLRDNWIRATTYMRMAQTHAKKHAAVAREALRKALDAAEKCEPEAAVGFFIEAADIYMKMEDDVSAKQALERGMAVTSKLYEVDSNPDNPNLSPVCFWPSTVAWLKMVRSGRRFLRLGRWSC